jgi:hypothetical protein
MAADGAETLAPEATAGGEPIAATGRALTAPVEKTPVHEAPAATIKN